MNNEAAALIQNLTTNQVIRALLRDLWIRYDFGGVSMGRSLRAQLLESIFFLWPKTDKIDRTGYISFEVLTELEKRVKKPREIQLVFPKLSMMPFSYFCCLVLQELRWHYQENYSATTEVFDITWEVSLVEYLTICMICRLMNVDYYVRQFNQDGLFSIAEILQEGRDREQRGTREGLFGDHLYTDD